MSIIEKLIDEVATGIARGVGIIDDEPRKTYYACPECGCTDVQITAWVYANTGLNTNDESPAEYAYCPQCNDSDIRDRDLVEVTELQPFEATQS